MRNAMVICMFAMFGLFGCGADDGDQYKHPYDGGIEIKFSCVGCNVADLIITIYSPEGEFLTRLSGGEDTVYLEYLKDEDYYDYHYGGNYYVTFVDQEGNYPFNFIEAWGCMMPTADDWYYRPTVHSSVTEVGIHWIECLPAGVEEKAGFTMGICDPEDDCCWCG